MPDPVTLPGPTVWILTDGKAGDEQPLIGIAEQMGVVPSLRHVAPRKPFALLMPWGPIDPKDHPGKPGSPLTGPAPDICLATGRRAVAYLRALKRRSPGTLTVFVKDPRTRRHGADLVVVQSHDRLAGRDVMVVTTAPNRISVARLDAIRQAPPTSLAALPAPRLAVLIGGNSRHHRFEPGDIDRLISGLADRLDAGASLMITASRRTPDALKTALTDLSKRPNTVFWDGTGDNPLVAYLALADAVIVTADSTNMIGEAAATGRPVQVFHPTGGHPKVSRFLASLGQQAAIGTFPDREAHDGYEAVNSTPGIAAAILSAWRARIER
ncbi:nucleoside-diphosphate sugar epimerase [Rhizobium sp. CG5]|uniref:mitochondrial fission ELM1 family protein n=1 Tax=Rhizobium sp. CG5 TaxID=2726076 RepID=UPI00203452C6|nr:mitochondrial fission ELM1 family protein [Rhizobium sp. CG5]MCM2471870.1 nucleoside-diphosphate sugar epimerase [Rhizobium sp. CG5]